MSTLPSSRFRIVSIPEDPEAVLRQVREGLTRDPRELSPRFFYDDAGSRLFEEITRLLEYYQTRTEDRILREVAAEVIDRTGAEVLIELGSGASTKTRVLLDAMERADSLRGYVPFDVSEGIVRRAAGELLERYPGLEVHAVIGDFTEHLDHLPPGSRELCIFLGGTIGNFRTEESVRFLRRLARQLEPGNHFLLGTDLIKDPARLHAAYNDSQGVTARFNLNILNVLNRLLGGDFDPGNFRHRAFYREDAHRIEMWLRAERSQAVRLPRIDLEFTVNAGEEILTEISTKFDRELVHGLLAAAGFELVGFYTDPESLFALSLARRL